ncbi:hypothetical protein CF319_g9122 [Tilletia indica]|nr:hypothetical protein CF319_g9122 [Tilletia indica]
MWFHLHLIPLQEGREVPTASWPAYEDGHFFIQLPSGLDDAHPPSPASQPLQILFKTGSYFVRPGGPDSTVRINGIPVPPGEDTPLLQSDLFQFGCSPAGKYIPSFTCRIDLGCSLSASPAFPGPYTHITSNMKFSSSLICFDDAGRALDDSARHYGHKSPCPPLRPAAFSFIDCTVSTSSLLPRRDDAPLPAFFPHVPTSPVSALTPSYDVTIRFAPRTTPPSAASVPLLAPTSSPTRSLSAVSPSDFNTSSSSSPPSTPTSASITSPSLNSTFPATSVLSSSSDVNTSSSFTTSDLTSPSAAAVPPTSPPSYTSAAHCILSDSTSRDSQDAALSLLAKHLIRHFMPVISISACIPFSATLSPRSSSAYDRPCASSSGRFDHLGINFGTEVHIPSYRPALGSVGFILHLEDFCSL